MEAVYEGGVLGGRLAAAGESKCLARRVDCFDTRETASDVFPSYNITVLDWHAGSGASEAIASLD